MTDHDHFRRWTLALAVAATIVASLLLAPHAQAGTYRATQCNSGLGAGSGDAVFHRTSNHYVSHVGCGGTGLEIGHVAGHRATRSGRYGAWTLAAPSGARIVRANVRVEGQGRSGHRPELMIGTTSNRQKRLSRAAGSLHTVAWRSLNGALSLTARLRCTRPRCGKGRGASMALHHISLLLSDTIGPALGLGGSIYDEGSRRGTQKLESIASDSGGGVRSVGVEVNGRTVASRPNGCAVRRNVAIRLRPCPERVTSSFSLRTDAGPFRQGRNEVRVCASDFARDSVANRRCRIHTVHIDNLCPVSQIGATRLSATFSRGRTRISVASKKRARVRGRLTDSAGRGVGDARVCLASTVRDGGRRGEEVVATPVTATDGSFSARLPRGPNRAIRVADWPNTDSALEQHLLLGSRAIPSLRLRPKRAIRNGTRVRFRVRVPAPHPGHPRVEVQARSGKRWIRVARGRTGPDGIWRGSYRFHATTGSRRYAFRAVVPHSKGYPFQAGHSATRHAHVHG
jgi:hypothetical protein